MKKIIFIVSIIAIINAFSNNLKAQDSYRIRGTTLDTTNTFIDFVNIGIVNKNFGTVSNDSGTFILYIPEELVSDSLTFSRIGFYTKKISIKELLMQKNIDVILKQKINELKEVTVSTKRIKQKRKGNITRSHSIVMGLTSDSAKLGFEVGTLIRFPDKSILIKDFNFHISSNRPDSVRLRLKIYEYNKKIIGKNLLNDNIYFTVKKEDYGDFKVDLSKYNVIVSNNVLFAVENVAIYVTEDPNSDIKNDKYYYNKITISGSVLKGSKSFFRKVSQGNWKKTPFSFSPGFWVTYLE